MSFNSPIQNIFLSYGINSNFIKVHLFVPLKLHGLRSTLIALAFEFVDFTTVSRLFGTLVSALLVNLVTVLFINMAALLYECSTRNKTCLYGVIQYACEDSVGLYREIYTVKHSQQLIEDNYKSDRRKRTLKIIWRGFDIVCDFVDLFNSVYSAHTLVLVTCYVVIFIYDSYYGLVRIMNVNRGTFGTVIWVRVTCTETAFNGAGFMVLIYFCSSTTCKVRCCTNVLFYCSFSKRCKKL
jgi:hypothetical protein